TLGGLGELLVCETGSSPSRLVDRLVDLGLVRRQDDPQDRRAVTLTLTEEGRRGERQVASAQRRRYKRLGQLVNGQPLEPALDLLRTVAKDLPAGRALARRRQT